MNDAAAKNALELLRKQKSELNKLAPGAITEAAEDTYTKLVINVNKRSRVALGFVVMFLLMLWVVDRDILTDRHWGLVAIPIIGIGMLSLLLPISEDWRYRPWQSRARRYEQHLTK